MSNLVSPHRSRSDEAITSWWLPVLATVIALVLLLLAILGEAR
jgi:hypothetical protein